jgi:hypothetical protein
LLGTAPTKLNRELVVSAFGGREGFESFHRQIIPTDILSLMSMD